MKYILVIFMFILLSCKGENDLLVKNSYVAGEWVYQCSNEDFNHVSGDFFDLRLHFDLDGEFTLESYFYSDEGCTQLVDLEIHQSGTYSLGKSVYSNDGYEAFELNINYVDAGSIPHDVGMHYLIVNVDGNILRTSTHSMVEEERSLEIDSRFEFVRASE